MFFQTYICTICNIYKKYWHITYCTYVPSFTVKSLLVVSSSSSSFRNEDILLMETTDWNELLTEHYGLKARIDPVKCLLKYLQNMSYWMILYWHLCYTHSACLTQQNFFYSCVTNDCVVQDVKAEFISDIYILTVV